MDIKNFIDISKESDNILTSLLRLNLVLDNKAIRKLVYDIVNSLQEVKNNDMAL